MTFDGINLLNSKSGALRPAWSAAIMQQCLLHTSSCIGEYHTHLYEFSPRQVAWPVNDGSINGEEAEADSCRGGRQPGKAV